jgi:putative PIN family toxin of toxin-antitoxin system
VTTAVLDTNVFVQTAIGSPRTSSTRVLRACDEGRFRLVFSPATLDELLNVLIVPSIQARHRWSEDEVLRFVLSFLPAADVYPGRHHVSVRLTRDVSDTKFLALAEEAGADYLVSNDRRHLVPLGRHGRTRIVTPAQFLRELRSSTPRP